MNYWQNTHIYDPQKDRNKLLSFKNSSEEIEIWKNTCKNYLCKLNADIILLQEINPFKLFGEEYIKNNKNLYLLNIENMSIYYYELYDELYNERLRENFWGNAIIINNKKIRCISDGYLGQYGLMGYDFITKNDTSITIINYYNKRDNEKDYAIPKEIQTDLENITKGKNNNIVLFAGDFNADKIRKENNITFFNFLEKKDFFNDFTKGKEFDNTMVPEAKPYPNDKVFIMNESNVKNIECKKIIDTNVNLSDHCPIRIKMTEQKEIETDKKQDLDERIYVEIGGYTAHLSPETAKMVKEKLLPDLEESIK
jgi:endonuclease/exonuclease/phosphatase family metal-dependent hydrolase